MIKIYLYNTLISFISLNCAIHITKDNWLKLDPETKEKNKNILKRNFEILIFCLIPIFRWITVFLILIIGVMLGNDEFCEKYKKKLTKK